MNGSALARLFTGTARGGRGRLLGMIAGVMIGVALVLLLWGGASNLGERSIRGSAADWPSGDRYLYDPALLGDDEAAVRATLDYFDGTPIPVLHIAVTESTTMTAPGLERIPGPGEYVASPAMVALIDENPGELLGDRYGARTGEISRDGLSSPDQLQLFVGHSAAELLELSGGSALLLTEFEGTDFDSAAYRALTIVGVIAVLTPVLLLIGIVTNLGSAQRAERIATLRLIGASPRQVARLTAAETAIATAVGSLLGVGAYFLLIPLAAQMPINDGRFYYRDLMASPWEIAAVVVAAVGLSVLVAYRRAVRSDLGPLGGSRERHERPPRATSFIPLAIGVALMGVGVWLASEGYATSMPLMIGAFVLIIGGILWSGPYLTATVATAVARHASGPTAVIAMGRIVRHPRAAFRAVSGLIVAVFTATVFAVAVTSSEEIPPVPNEPGSIRADVLAAHVSVDQDHELLDRVRGEIEALSGVTAAVIASQNHDAEMVFAAEDVAALVPDADLPSGAQWVSVSWEGQIGGGADGPGDPTLGSTLLVATDGAMESIERARTAIVASDRGVLDEPYTRADAYIGAGQSTERQYAALAYLGILVATAISAVALAVSSLASVLERKRVFGLLRLTGLRARGLRRVISVEALLPAATVFVGSVGLGAAVAVALVVGLTSGRRTVGWPDGGYYLVLLGCALLMVFAVVGTFRAAVRATSGDATRFE